MGTANVVSSYDPTGLIAGAYPVRHRVVTLAAGANAVGAPLKRGTLLGRVTASDKHIISVKTAVDGSQIPVAVLAFDTDASAVDTRMAAYYEAELAGEMMTFDPSWTIPTIQAALRQAGSQLYVRSIGVLG